MSEHNTFIISGLKEKRSAVAGRIVDLRREADKLQADLVHIDAVPGNTRDLIHVACPRFG